MIKLSAVQNHFARYLQVGGFPELERIFLYLCYVSSNVVSIDAIVKELNGVYVIGRIRLKNMLEHK